MENKEKTVVSFRAFDIDGMCEAACQGDGGAAAQLIDAGWQAVQMLAEIKTALATFDDEGVWRAALGGDSCATDSLIYYGQKALKILSRIKE